MVRQDARETAAADVAVDAAETAYPAGEPPTVTAYKATKAGYGHWEIRRITYPGGTPDYHEHRDRQAQGDWMGGLPEGLTKAHLVPMETEQDPATHPTVSLETACTAPAILEAVARYIQPTCSPEMIPDMETLATWVTNDCPSDARAAADTLLMATWGRRAAWLVSGNGEPDSPPRRLMAYVDKMLAGDGAPDNVAMVNLETVHSVWLRGGVAAAVGSRRPRRHRTRRQAVAHPGAESQSRAAGPLNRSNRLVENCCADRSTLTTSPVYPGNFVPGNLRRYWTTFSGTGANRRNSSDSVLFLFAVGRSLRLCSAGGAASLTANGLTSGARVVSTAQHRYASAALVPSSWVYCTTMRGLFQRPWFIVTSTGAPLLAMRRAMPTRPLCPEKPPPSPAAVAAFFRRR